MFRDRDLWPQAGEAEQAYPARAQPQQVAEPARLMLDHGYAAADVGKVLGGNFLRVTRAAARASGRFRETVVIRRAAS